MLCSLDIRDMLIIDRLSLVFQPGLNVLTGETGAGKSILLDSLGFVLGWRGRSGLVRMGAQQGEVTAVFDPAPNHPAYDVLAQYDIAAEGELILRRVNHLDGRKTAWVNDRRVSGEVLRQLADTLIELHGQHDDRGLLNPRGHRLLLDRFANLEVTPCRAAWQELAGAKAALADAQAALTAQRLEEEYLRHAVAELDQLDPKPGEDAALDSRRRLMQGAEKMRADMGRAVALLADQGAESQMIEALRRLENLDHPEGGLSSVIAALNRALLELDEAQIGLRHCLDRLDVSPAELEMIEERLFAIRALARKHSVLPDDLGDFAHDLRTRLAALDHGAQNLAALAAQVEKAQACYDSIASALTQARIQAAQRLDRAMMAELAPLKMERAVFTTHITPTDAGPEGCDMVQFTVATNPGAPAGPLDRIASGGELSRFLLALKVCLSANMAGMTMIFDEIDRGVGGATADAVGRRLQALAKGAQILVVTHSPQVAALGAHHWRVEKQVQDGATLSRVVALSDKDRTEEIARMLAGDSITPEARAAAAALLKG